MHGKAIWKPELDEIAKASRGIAPGTYKVGFTVPYMNPQLQESNVLMHIVLQPMAIKLNPSWKMEVSKGAWTKPWKYQNTMLKINNKCCVHWAEP